MVSMCVPRRVLELAWWPILRDGTGIDVVCQTRGDDVMGSTMWDRIEGPVVGYLADYYTTTPVVNNPSPGLPGCPQSTTTTTTNWSARCGCSSTRLRAGSARDPLGQVCSGVAAKLGDHGLLHPPRSCSGHAAARLGGRLRGVLGKRRPVAAPAHLPGVRKGRVLRRFAQSSRQGSRSQQRPSIDSLHRARRGVVVVLRGRCRAAGARRPR
jgi:hypothetical protein